MFQRLIELCSEVKTDYPNFVWLITTLVGFSIHDFCFYYLYRILFGSLGLCSASGLGPREKKRTGSPGTSTFSRASVIYFNY